MKSIYVITVEYLPHFSDPGGEGVVGYCLNQKEASETVKRLNKAHEKYGELYDFEEIDYIGKE